jgi:hypothetical protein
MTETIRLENPLHIFQSIIFKFEKEVKEKHDLASTKYNNRSTSSQLSPKASAGRQDERLEVA